MLESEDKLIKQAKKGDEGAFGRLYDRYIGQIYRFVLVKVNGKAEAEDLTHDVFLSAWQNLKGYRDQGHPFSSWLYQIARNRVIDHYRTKKAHASIEETDEELFKVVGVVENTLETRLTMEKIKSALARLSPDQQDVIMMKFVEDLSNEEIAKAMDKSEGAIRLLQFRAIQNLKDQLS